MQNSNPIQIQRLSQYVGWSLIATIIIGIIATMTISSGIDVNLSADISKTAENMLNAENQLRAKAYIALLIFMLELFFAVGLYFVLRDMGPVLATWSMLLAISASVISVLGAVYAMNAAMIAGNSAFDAIGGTQQLLLNRIQVTSDYTSFHLSIVLSSIAKAAFFFLFFRSNAIPAPIAGWGIFASLFVAIAIVSRDFIPVLGHFAVTSAFMVSNLIALVALGLYLSIKGVRV